MTYLVEIKSFEDLKAKYREWALKLHPDMGGTDAEMQVLNNEYDQLFPVWKNRSEVHTKETADSDRRWFYTQNGWAGKNYKSGRTTKEIAEIIRTYLKEVYSDCKWSVRYSSASMCTSISVALMEAPYQVFVDENETHIDLNQYYMDREERLVPKAKAMMTDVVEFINSYRYDDSDGMIDYFDTNFYYDVSVGKWDKPFKVVYREKKKPDNRQYETVTVKQTKTRKVIKAHEVAAPLEWKVGQHIILKTGFTYGCHRGAIYEIVSLDHDRVDCLKMGRKLDKHVTSYNQRGNRFCAGQDKFMKWVETNAIGFVALREETETYEVEKTVKRPIKPETKIEGAQSYEYTVREDVDTRDQTPIWLVKFITKLDKETYVKVAKQMRELGGYYSKFKSAFLFRVDPTEQVKELFA